MNFKKIWGITTYFLVLLAIIQTFYSAFSGNIIFVVKGIIYIVFTTSLLINNKLTNKNKMVEIIFLISCILIILFDIPELFLKYKRKGLYQIKVFTLG